MPGPLLRIIDAIAHDSRPSFPAAGIPVAEVWRKRSPYLLPLAVVWAWAAYAVFIAAFARWPSEACSPMMCEACAPSELGYDEHRLLCEAVLAAAAAAGGGNVTAT